MTETQEAQPESSLSDALVLEGFDEPLPSDGRLPPAPQGVLGTFHELLQHPVWPAARVVRASEEGVDRGHRRWFLSLLVGTLLCFTAYGASMGFYGGGWLPAVTAFKAPLILLLSLLLCAPSLYVFGSLTGVRFNRDRFLLCLGTFGALLGLILFGFLPISWLFSVSSRSVGTVAFTQMMIWIVAVAFAGRGLSRLLCACGARGILREGATAWVLVFVLVSFQATTYLRPVVGWRPGEALFVSEKMWFLEHFGRSLGAVKVEKEDGG